MYKIYDALTFKDNKFPLNYWPYTFSIKVVMDKNISCNDFLEIIQFAEGYDYDFVLLPYSKDLMIQWDRNVKSIGAFEWYTFRPVILFPSLIDLSLFIYAFGHLPIREFTMQTGDKLIGHKEVRRLLDTLP